MWELLPLVAIVVLFWLLIIRPAQRRQRATIELQQALGVGDEVMLTSGFYGRLRSIDDDRLRVALSDDVVVTVARAAVARVVDPEEGTAAPDGTPVSGDVPDDLHDDLSDDLRGDLGGELPGSTGSHKEG